MIAARKRVLNRYLKGPDSKGQYRDPATMMSSEG